MRMRRILGCVLLVLVAASSSWALKPVEPSPLATAPTWCDAGGVWQVVDNRVVDTRNGQIQCVSDLREGGFSGSPEDVAWAFLRAHEDWVGISPDADLRVERSVDSPFGHHVTLERVINGVPVYPGDLVVSMDKDNVVRFYFSSVFTFKDHPSTTPSLTAAQARQAAENYLHPKGPSTYEPKTDLVVWAGDNRDFALCWKYRAYYEDPQGDWEVLVDAHTGRIRRAVDRACYINGSGLVHRPDPLTSAGANYGDAGFTDNNDANSTQLQGQRVSVVLPDIRETYVFPFYWYDLYGPWVHLQDIESPSGAPVSQLGSTDFSYTRDAQPFEDVMCYYHIDTSQRWIQSLGFTNIQYGSIAIDPHGFNGADNSHYVPGGNYIAFGEGGVDDDEDADVIWHEYGHAIQASSVPGWGGGDEGGMGEGFGDYWAGSYSRSLYTFHDTWVFNWDGHNTFWPGRVLNANYHYPENNGEVHDAGMIWSQPLYESMLQVGRGTMDRIVLGHHFLLGTSASMPTAALALLTEDGTLNGGYNRWAISDACVPRGLLSRPANDVCPGTTISALPYSGSGTTATADHNYLNFMGNQSPDVVYTLAGSALPCNATVTVSLCGSGYDTGVSVYTGGSCPGNTLVGGDDDGCGYPYSQFTFNATGGTTYYIIVHGYSLYSGSYSINVTKVNSVPSNDTCPGMAFTSLPFSHSGSTGCATNDYDVACVGGDANDVFYNMTLSSCQTVTVSLCGSGYDTGLEVRSGGSCPGSTDVACDDDFCGYPPGNSQVTFVAQAGVTYYIIVDGFGSNSGAYTLNATGVPFIAPNDVCPGTAITALPYSDSGNTLCANNDFDVACVYGDANDVFYNLTLPTCQTVTVSLCGSGYDTGLEVRTGGACPGTASVACDDDFCGYPPGNSQVTFTAIAGQAYYIIVDGYFASAGSYVINVTGTPFAPANDVCPGTTIATLPYSDAGDTRCATNDYDAGCVYGDPADVVYNLTLPSCQTVTVSLCGSGYDTGLEVRYGGSCPGATVVACNDDFCGLQSELTFQAFGGVTYYIIVDGYGTASGPFVLNVTGVPYAPPNDACPGTAISALPYTDNGDTRCATNNFDICVYGDANDVFYNLNLATCQVVTVSLCGSIYDTGLEVRTGGACPGTTAVICNDDYCGLQSQVTFTAQPGTPYYIVIDGFAGDAGPYTINVTGAPCSAPSAPTSLVALVSGTNINLYWPSVPGAASYKVYRKVTPDVAPIPGDFLADAPTNSFIDAGVITTGNKYFYVVTALSASGDLVAGVPSQPDGQNDEAYVQRKLTAEQSGKTVAAYEPILSSFAAEYAAVAQASAAKSVTSTGPVDVDFTPYTNAPLMVTVPTEKTVMPADETLRVENLFIPAYTKFTSQNVISPDKERAR